jgi:hypothetical protein
MKNYFFASREKANLSSTSDYLQGKLNFGAHNTHPKITKNKSDFSCKHVK